jgi:hypothetical protein
MQFYRASNPASMFFYEGSTTTSLGFLLPASVNFFSMCRDSSGVYRFHVNGVQQATFTSVGYNFIASRLRFGADFNGTGTASGLKISEVRVSVGIAYYTTTTYTVPSGPFTE